jgi:hypothetical protein
MDAGVVSAMIRWIMAELVRIFHAVSPEDATAIVDALTEREMPPLLWRMGDRIRVLGVGLSAKDKALALLYGSTGTLSVREVVTSIEYANVSQFRAKVLKPAHKADLIHFDIKTDTVTLSPVGVRYVEQKILLTA